MLAIALRITMLKFIWYFQLCLLFFVKSANVDTIFGQFARDPPVSAEAKSQQY